MTARPQTPHSTQAGLSAIEMVIAVLALSSALGVAVSSIAPQIDERAFTLVEADAHRRAGQAMDLLCTEMARSDGRFELRATEGGQTAVHYRRQEAVEGNTEAASAEGHSFGYRISAAESLNTTDDDDNGLSDEGCLYLKRPGSANGQQILTNILPGSLTFEPLAEGSQTYVLRFQMAVRLHPEAGVYSQEADGSGLYPGQDGFLVITRERRVNLAR